MGGLAGRGERLRWVHALLVSGRQRTRQARELFRIDADLLAHASLLLDDIQRSATAKAMCCAAAQFRKHVVCDDPPDSALHLNNSYYGG